MSSWQSVNQRTKGSGMGGYYLTLRGMEKECGCRRSMGKEIGEKNSGKRSGHSRFSIVKGEVVTAWQWTQEVVLAF